MLARSRDWLDGPYGYIPFTVSADFTFICNDAVVQYIQTLGMSTAELTFFRLVSHTLAFGNDGKISYIQLFTATVCATYLWFTDRAQIDLFRSELRLVWMRGIADVLGLMLVYQAFEYMPLSNAITVLQLRPFIVGFICMVILKEAFTWRQAVACGKSNLSPRPSITHSRNIDLCGRACSTARVHVGTCRYSYSGTPRSSSDCRDCPLYHRDDPAIDWGDALASSGRGGHGSHRDDLWVVWLYRQPSVSYPFLCLQADSCADFQ